MKKATIIIEVSEAKTEVVSIGITGNTQKTDITGTDAENHFVKFLRAVKEHEATKQVLDAIDIKRWDEIPATPEAKVSYHCGLAGCEGNPECYNPVCGRKTPQI